MIDLLLGIPKQLDDLLARLSAPWAAKLDAIHTGLSAGTRMANLDKLALTGKATDDAVWTNAHADKVALINTLSGAVPKLNGLLTTKANFRHGSSAAAGITRAGAVTMVSTVNNTYKTLLSISGSGLISFLSVLGPTNNMVSLDGVKITVDGVVIYEDTIGVVGDGTYGWGVCPIGMCVTDEVTPPNIIALAHGLPVPFKTSFLVEVKTNAASSGPNIYGYYAGSQVS